MADWQVFTSSHEGAKRSGASWEDSERPEDPGADKESSSGSLEDSICSGDFGADREDCRLRVPGEVYKALELDCKVL